MQNGFFLNENRVHELHLHKLRHHSLGLISAAENTFHTPYVGASCPSLHEILRSQPSAHLLLQSLEACCCRVYLQEHRSAPISLTAWTLRI